MRLSLQFAAAFLGAAAQMPAAHLGVAARQAFDSYVADVEVRLERQHAGSGYLATLPASARLRSGSVTVEPVSGGTWDVSGALMHHWRAAGFVPGADAGEMIALLRDPGRLSRFYAPQVVSSRALREGPGVTSLIRFKKQKIVTVVLDAEFEGQARLTAPGRGYSFARSRHIWQVDDAGTAREHRRVEGDDDGFLWRLNSYWSFVEAGGGLFMECEAVSLTRGIPRGLGWLIGPIVQSLPRESLEFTLNATKNALSAYAMTEVRDDHAN